MLAGHVGVGLALGRAERGTNVALFVAAALLLDFLLWALILLGAEAVTLPPGFVQTRQPEFDFPYSHGLAACSGWAILAGSATYALGRAGDPVRLRRALLVAAAVASHWLLDALVHAPELPLLGASSPKVGLGLWDRLGMALTAEALLTVAGLALFLRGAQLPRPRKVAFGVLTLLVLGFTVIGMAAAPPPPSAAAMAASSLGMLVVVCGLFAWLGRGEAARR